MRASLCTVLMSAVAVLATLTASHVLAQPPATQNSSKQPNTAKQDADKALPVATVNQLMRGLYFPHSNVVFSPQRQDPNEVKMAPEPSAATDPLTGVFGKWEAVENSALVLIETADLLLQPRLCSNGKEAPVNAGDWKAMTAMVKSAGKVAYEAAKTKNIDKMFDAAEVLNNSCSTCHNRYRRATRCQ